MANASNKSPMITANTGENVISSNVRLVINTKNKPKKEPPIATIGYIITLREEGADDNPLLFFFSRVMMVTTIIHTREYVQRKNAHNSCSQKKMKFSL
jgi:hypothetical protein